MANTLKVWTLLLTATFSLMAQPSHSDLFTFGPRDLPLAQFEERLRSWA